MKRELSRCALSCAAVYAVYLHRARPDSGSFQVGLLCDLQLINKLHQPCVMGAGKKKRRLDISYCVACVP